MVFFLCVTVALLERRSWSAKGPAPKVTIATTGRTAEPDPDNPTKNVEDPQAGRRSTRSSRGLPDTRAAIALVLFGAVDLSSPPVQGCTWRVPKRWPK